uniref:Uncharacterized protein n=1 Tax=Arundo donax TaxID=35708 RepID=A0A0A8XPA4_ARUDO
MESSPSRSSAASQKTPQRCTEEDGRKLGLLPMHDASMQRQSVVAMARWWRRFPYRETEGFVRQLVMRCHREAAPCQPYAGFTVTLLIVVDRRHYWGCAFAQPSRQPPWLHWLLY